jgi:hypothetical protein
MPRSRKKPCKQPSIIDTNLNNCFSPSHSDADIESDNSSQSTESLIDVPAIPKKCQKVAVTQAAVPSVPAGLITYVASIFNSTKMKKHVSK